MFIKQFTRIKLIKIKLTKIKLVKVNKRWLRDYNYPLKNQHSPEGLLQDLPFTYYISLELSLFDEFSVLRLKGDGGRDDQL